jgi:hypothetical protein
MEPLFLAVICGCNAGLFHEALHEIYIPRIQRGDAAFAANVLGARGALLSVLVHFFERGCWDLPLQAGAEAQNLTVEDQLLVLLQAALYLTATRGLGSPEALMCYERAEALCHSHNRPLLLYSALIGQWHFSLVTDKLTATMQIAKRIYALAHKQNDPALMTGANRVFACTSYFLGDFEAVRRYATQGLRLWRSERIRSAVQEVEVDPPAIACLIDKALSEWHFGKIASCRATIAEAVSLAKELNSMHGLAEALCFATHLSHYERHPAEAESLASELIELSTRQNFAFWRAVGEVLRGWAQSASGHTAEGLSRIENGIENWRTTGLTIAIQFYLALKAEAFAPG